MPLVNNQKKSVRDTLPIIQAWGAPGTFCLSVVTEHHKYVNWPYAEGMPATEELFDLEKDPNELKTFTGNPEYGAVLESMRKLYDTEVAKWKKEAVAHNNYQSFATLYDRTIPWADKKAAGKKRAPNGAGAEKVKKQNKRKVRD